MHMEIVPYRWIELCIRTPTCVSAGVRLQRTAFWVIFGVIYAAVAGIMVYISFDELLPSAREYGEHHLSILGLIIGMFVMAVSLIFV